MQRLTNGIARAVESSVRKGMLVSFIDFKKAYDRVDRGKLWGCLKGMGIGGWALAFLKAAYSDVSCEVKVGAGRSDPFEVSCGLRQGCILSPGGWYVLVTRCSVPVSSNKQSVT